MSQAPDQKAAADTSNSGRAIWKRPMVIVSTFKRTEFDTITLPNVDGAGTAAKSS
jgi:hypothetical protein